MAWGGTSWAEHAECWKRGLRDIVGFRMAKYKKGKEIAKDRKKQQSEDS